VEGVKEIRIINLNALAALKGIGRDRNQTIGMIGIVKVMLHRTN